MSSTRRDFAKTLTVALVATSAGAQDAQPEKPSPLAAAWTQLVRAQFGQFLSDDELAQISKDFNDYAPYVEDFRKVTLKNGDEPDFTFHSLTDRW